MRGASQRSPSVSYPPRSLVLSDSLYRCSMLTVMCTECVELILSCGIIKHGRTEPNAGLYLQPHLPYDCWVDRPSGKSSYQAALESLKAK